MAVTAGRRLPCFLMPGNNFTGRGHRVGVSILYPACSEVLQPLCELSGLSQEKKKWNRAGDLLWDPGPLPAASTRGHRRASPVSQ